MSVRKEPPRLVVVQNEDQYTGFIFCDGLVINLPLSSDIIDMLLQLLHSYYAWGLTYPKHYQLLPFLQENILQDTEAT
jgi:PhoPQ-activated pathogenicity-related protein